MATLMTRNVANLRRCCLSTGSSSGSSRAFNTLSRFAAPPKFVSDQKIFSQNLLIALYSLGRPGHNTIQTRSLFIIAEATPNPESLMFYPQGEMVLGEGAKTKNFSGKRDPEVKFSLLANSLFKVHGVQGVMLAARHVTITKTPEQDWDLLQPNVELVMSQFFAAGLEVMQKDKIEYYAQATPGGDEESEGRDNLTFEELEKGIVDLLEERVQPFVQQDGGDIEFVRIDKESFIVWLKLLGACAGCPKSQVTLNMQVKQLIIHYFPQVKDVVEFVEEEEIPRGH